MKSKKIFITGGAGYVGTDLVEYLLTKGFIITVYDLLLYENNLSKHKNLNVIRGDIRDIDKIRKSIIDHDIVIHLACISNDPSFELNPELGKSINLDSFEPLVKVAREKKINRFIYASSSSVYGIKDMKNVSEDVKLEPITDYSKFKAECEQILASYKDDNFCTITVRPATVCGYSKRQRLDVIVNILTNLGFHNKKITIFGGDQLRPNIHIKDMSRAYELLINAPKNLVNGEVFNAGWENRSVNDIALMVKNCLGPNIELVVSKTNDNRSYHISSEKIKKILNFNPKFTIIDAVNDLKIAFEKKLLVNPLSNPNFYNIKKMQIINLK